MNFLRKLFGAKSAPVPAPSVPPPSVKPSVPVARPDPTPARPTAPTPPPVNTGEPPASLTLGSLDPVPSAPRPRPSTPPAKVETTLLTIDGPVWLPGDSPALELFPAKSDDAPAIAFLGGSAELSPVSAQANAALASRLTRALPLYLAEQVEFGTAALARTLVAWVVSPTPGFILGGAQWDDSTAARHARQSSADDPADYLVVTHLRCVESPWTIELRLVRTIDAACLATATAPCPPDDPARDLPGLVKELLSALATHAELPPAPLVVPGLEPRPATSAYVLGLEQLLATLTLGATGANRAPGGEHTAAETGFQLCDEHPGSLGTRLLLAQALRALKVLRPDLVAAYQERAGRLQTDHPITEPAHSVTDRLFADIFVP